MVILKNENLIIRIDTLRKSILKDIAKKEGVSLSTLINELIDLKIKSYVSSKID